MADIETVIRHIHGSGRQFVLAVTGGGASAIAQLLAVPGGSRSVLEAVVPYASEALTRFLGAQPEQYCSARTARAMAMAAFERSRQITVARPTADVEMIMGIGCTASLVSELPKKGPHRCHVGLQTATRTRTTSVELAKSSRTRQEEETIVCRILLNEIARACGHPEGLGVDLDVDEIPVVRQTDAHDPLVQLILGGVGAVGYQSGEPVAKLDTGVPSSPRFLFPGAFNPFHAGHREMAQFVSHKFGQPVQYEMSITNVDKPPLDYTELQTRLQQFPVDALVWLTRAPTFVEKSRLFPEATFVVGADTIKRIVDSKYYSNYSGLRDIALQEIRSQKCRFLVFGRQMNGQFCTLREINVPAFFEPLCIEIPGDAFRIDISSTELRTTDT